MADRRFIDDLADTWSALAALGRQLEPGEWELPTECPGWQVRDHYAHVVGTESTLLGRPSPPAGPAASHVRNQLGELNEAWVEHWRSRPLEDLQGELAAVTAHRLSSLAAMTDEQLDKPGWSPVGEVPYATFMGIRVMDCWIHEQDVRQATGRRWRLEGPVAATSLDRLLSSLGYVVGKRVAPAEGTVVRVRVTGPPGRDVTLVVRAGRAVPLHTTAVTAGGPAPAVTLFMPADIYVRLAAGRLRPAGAPVQMEGDRELGDAIVANLAHVP